MELAYLGLYPHSVLTILPAVVHGVSHEQYFGDEVDVYNVSAALNPSLQYQIDSNCFPDGWRAYLAKAVKERFGKPVVTMGNIRSPKVANDILERGDADFIGIGREQSVAFVEDIQRQATARP